MNEFSQLLMEQKGRGFWGKKLPNDIPRGEVGNCFDHCLLVALKSKGKYRYCEGYGIVKKHGKHFHHAWLTDAEGLNAYDPTWRVEGPERESDEEKIVFFGYRGVILDLDLVLEFVIKTEYKSPLANYFLDHDLAKKIYATAK